MAGSTTSSVTRYRPAVLVVTGAAAAYAAWLLYTTIQAPGSPPDSLQRSNAIRRTNRRARNRSHGSSRAVQRLQQESVPLGTFDFFGHEIELDARNVVSADHLREIAHELQPTASTEMVDDRITQLYDTFYDRLLGYAFPERQLSSVETDVLTGMMTDQIPNPEGLARAIERHRSRFTSSENETRLAADGVESIPPTELSWHSDDDTEDGIDPDGQTLQRTLYYIAEERAKHEGVIHRGITCNGCDAKPIRGTRWRCANCADYDLCSDCEASNSHIKTHIFYKIRVPAPYMSLPKQEAIYPGRPWLMTPGVDSVVKKKLVEQTRLETEEIEGLWDQFTCLASTEWTSDPNKIGWALDRRAFDHAFVQRYSSFTASPNLVYDRIFAYFDTDLDGLIGFEEFIKGLDGLHSSDASIRLRIAFNGYDIDGDGYISRKDVLRIFRAHYAIERESTRNYLAETQEELSIHGALETIRSAQPLGSAFQQGNNQAEPRFNEHLRGKNPDADDLDPNAYDIPDTMAREDAIDDFDRNGFLQDGGFHDPVAYRWDRRQFYTDEEEGLARPAAVAASNSFSGHLENQTDGEDEGPSASDHDRRRESRSSSRVRFQDDIDVETRSNASTSSRPIGERWGGYEIPEPEKDLGKEVLYQITQQAFNELLDPLFKNKEDAAMDVFATRTERRLRMTEIENLLEQFKPERGSNVLVLRYGPTKYSRLVTDALCFDDNVAQLLQNTEVVKKEFVAGLIEKAFAVAEKRIHKDADSWGSKRSFPDIILWNAKLCRTQILQEITETIVDVLHDRIAIEPLPTQDHEKNHVYQDPTMPQFRPDSLSDAKRPSTLGPIQDDEAEQTTQKKLPFGPFFVSNLKDASASTLPPPPPPTVAEFLAQDPNEITNEMQFLSLDPTHKTLAVQSRSNPNFVWDDPLKYPAAMQMEALRNTASPLHLPYLACLETVDKEIAHRKGSGLLDFDEFMESVEVGRWRFLECWMDLVSF